MDAAGKDSAIEHVMTGVNPQGVQVVIPVTLAGGARPRLPLAYLEGSARAWTHRHLQPLSLRGGHCSPGPPGMARATEAAARAARAGAVGGALRGHQYLRAPPRPERNQDREVLPPRVQEGTEGAFPRPAGHPGQRVEVQRSRRRREGALGRLHGRIRVALTATSTPWAPWHVVPADHKWLTQALIVTILVDTIQALDLSWPEVTEQEHISNLEARKKLELES